MNQDKPIQLGDPQSIERSPGQTCPIIGMGASAGGIEALRAFFGAVEVDCGFAFVVVQHLDPDHKSLLAEVLARFCNLPVISIEDNALIESNHVYVIPSNASLTIEAGRLHLTKPVGKRGHRTPIDAFFISLAQDQAENAACVILSGTGSDGTVGLRAIKDNGGLALAQEGAEYDGMMRSALSTGLVDFVLPADEMPAKLAEYFHHVKHVGDGDGPGALRKEITNSLGQLCGLLRTRTGHDFSGYKENTIIRRMQRRMHVLQIDNAKDFAERLRKDPREVSLLFQDVLIGVTSFFRDPPAFAALETLVIPHLFEGKGPEDAVRVWVPGCSTGEEAYSIAMLLHEYAQKSKATSKLQIFASDIDEHALEVARTGRYPLTISTDVPRKLLERYFSREDGAYRIVGDIRENVLVSLHNALRDPPFSKLDLISCRNFLIYLKPEMQNKLIPLFHYALGNSGYLLLGSSENVTRQSRLFSTVSKDNRIFKRRPQPQRQLPEFPLTAPAAPLSKQTLATRVKAIDASPQELAERQILKRYAPPYVVINAEGDVLHASGGTGKYLELPAGAPNNNVFSMARPGLRIDLRVAVRNAIQTGQSTVQNNILLEHVPIR